MTKPQLLYYLDNQLDVRTHFPLNYSSVIIDIDYTCSVSDYCDIDFVRETLSLSWNVASVKSIHETLVNRLYEANNTDPSFLPNNRQQSRDTGVFTCNKPHCASNASIIETFQWLSREYILPLNVSVLNLTTTTTISTTTTSVTTATTNNASVLFKYFNDFLSFFIALFVLQRSFLHT
ncbi:hypothetical protein I4U23_010181 [Adineta vaga]|nr:hypothetical protein I4U23_010181 [Adineta vaga]